MHGEPALPAAPPALTADLYRAQANDAYWHGLFGGLYLPHLRRAGRGSIVNLSSIAGLVGLAPRLAALLPVPVLDSLDCALIMACRGGPAARRVAQAPHHGRLQMARARCLVRRAHCRAHHLDDQPLSEALVPPGGRHGAGEALHRIGGRLAVGVQRPAQRNGAAFLGGAFHRRPGDGGGGLEVEVPFADFAVSCIASPNRIHDDTKIGICIR